MRAPLSYVPLLPVAVGLAAGILVCLMAEGVTALVVAAIFLGSGIVATVMKQWWWMEMLFGGCLGWVLCMGYEPLVEPREGYWTGRVNSVTVRDESVQLEVEIKGEKIDGLEKRIKPLRTRLVVVTSEEPELERGDKVGFFGELSPPSIERVLPYRETEREYLSRMGIGATAVVYNPDSLRIEKCEGVNGLFKSLRERSKTALLRSRLKPETKEFLTAIVLGDRSLLPDKAREDFARTGLSHMLALSGLHVGLLVVLLGYLLLPMRVIGTGRRSEGVVVCLILWGYALTTGMSPTVVRAVIMATVVIASQLSGKSYNPYNGMILAWIVLIISNPFNIFDVGFILSFAALLSVMMFSGSLSPWQRRSWPLREIGQIAGASLAATVGTGLVTCAIFNRFSLSFLVSNLIVLPLLPVVLCSGMCLTVFLLLGREAGWLCRIVDAAYSAIEGVTSWIASFGFTVVEDIYVPLWLAFMWIGVLLVWGRWMITRSSSGGRSTGLAALILSAGCLGAVVVEAQPDRRLEPKVYLLNDSEYTTLMVHNINRIELVSSMPERKYEGYLREFRSVNKEFIYRQGVDSISLRGPQLMTAGGKRILLIDNCRKVRSMAGRVDYAVLGRNFTGSMGSLSDSIEVETVVLGHRFPRKRRARIEEECKEKGIGVSMNLEF